MPLYAEKNFFGFFVFFQKFKLFIVNRLTMAKRIYRELTDDVKKSISDSMKNYHKSMTYDDKQRVNNKRSSSMLRYWAGILSKKENDE